MGFIGGTADKPAPITQKEADAILRRVQEGVEKPQPEGAVRAGRGGARHRRPVQRLHGIVEEVNYEKSRLRVAVLIFGRSTPVELDFGQVEKA